MKLVIAICLLLAAVKSHAGNYMDSSEEDSEQSRFYNVLKYMGMESSYQFQSKASTMPGAGPYINKVTQRIENSSILSNMEDLQEKLYKLADDKLEQCRIPMRQELDRHCVGRITGQIMQFISTVENSNR